MRQGLQWRSVLRQPQRLEELASADPRLRIASRGRGASTRPSSPQVMPMAALEAFQLAFPLPELPACFGREVTSHPLSQQVALLIKSFPPRGFHPEWHWLELRAAEDPRIHLVASNLERDELLALYGCCDVFLSLHRSEGFGRGMAEALQLGVDVIATEYGGNRDFCSGPHAHPVRRWACVGRARSGARG